MSLARKAAARAYRPTPASTSAARSIRGWRSGNGRQHGERLLPARFMRRAGALTAAQHNFGLGKVARIAVVGGDGDMICTPCGGCRQAILEAAQLSGRDVEILCGSGDGSAVDRHVISALIPFGFGPANSSRRPNCFRECRRRRRGRPALRRHLSDAPTSNRMNSTPRS